MPKSVLVKGTSYEIPVRSDPPPWSKSITKWYEDISRLVSEMSDMRLYVGQNYTFKTLEEALDYAKENTKYKEIIICDSRDEISKAFEIDIGDLKLRFNHGVYFMADPARFRVPDEGTELEKSKAGSIFRVSARGVTIEGGRIGFSPEGGDFNYAIFADKSCDELMVSGVRFVGLRQGVRESKTTVQANTVTSMLEVDPR